MTLDTAQLTEQQLCAAANRMIGFGGSFAGHIGKAFLVADLGNRAKLVTAFADLFEKYANWDN